jgi:anti-sigma regulatory factor (Ser/Thr protein kinase)
VPGDRRPPSCWPVGNGVGTRASGGSAGYASIVTGADEHEPDLRYEFGHDRRAAAEARRRIEAMLTDPADPIADDVRLTTSELVTNVVMHTADGGELRAWDPQPDVPLRLEVEDRDPAVPASPAEPPPVGGRGLAIVDAVADDWGIDEQPSGKVVWAEFDRSRRQRAIDD